MIDKQFNVKRYITEFSEETELLLAEYDLRSFELKKFQEEFGEPDPDDPMYYCYEIRESNIEFLKPYLSEDINWDFERKSYFVEACAI